MGKNHTHFWARTTTHPLCDAAAGFPADFSPLPAAALAKRREGGQVVEVEHLLFHARDARGCRVLPSLLECGSTKEIVAQDCGRWLAHPPVAAGGAGGSRRVDHVQATGLRPIKFQRSTNEHVRGRVRGGSNCNLGFAGE